MGRRNLRISMIETLQTIHNHDLARLQNLAALIGSAGTGLVSFEGEPLYADRAWDGFHDFSYGTIIPTLAERLADRPHRLDVLYDEYTVSSADFSEDHFLGQISTSLAEHNGSTRNVPVRTANESDMSGRAHVWVDELRVKGIARALDGVVQLTMPERAPVALTTQLGRPTCAVLDAVYQTSKSDQGISTAVLVHSKNFGGQQRDMQTVMRAIHDGELPFDAFVNVFVRERKGMVRLANIRRTNRDGSVMEIA